MALRRLFFLLILLLLPGLAGLPANPAFAATVSGKVTVKALPAAGVRVEAYPVGGSTLTGPAPYRSNVSTGDGLFALELPPGTYYFLARGDELFAYYGRNPVTVPAAGLAEMNLGLVSRHPPAPGREPQTATGLLGRVGTGEGPLTGAVIYVYTDLTSDLKGMGLAMTAPTDAQGIFEVQLPPGTYYLVARQRRSGGFAGPLQAGDYIGYYPENPVRVTEGEVIRVAIPMLEVPEKVDRLAASLFGQTSIHGRIVDRQGRPVQGVRAFLYDDPQMLNRPLYVSQPTGEDGTFVLSFPRGGDYYLSARNALGGAPAPGELFGTYDAAADHVVRVETGQALTGIEIVVEEMW